MSNLFDRLGDVVKSEWNSRFGEEDPSAPAPDRRERYDASTTQPPSSSAAWTHARPSVKSAYKMLELDESAALDEVRAAYFDLAKHYHPKTHADSHEQALTAQKLLDALTEALEVLEEHLLPVADVRSK